jgi:predicted flap endonuclease-1-like 5' DNA nuclease
MSFETPQMYRWRDPAWPPHFPALNVHFVQDSQVNAEATARTGVQTYDNVLIAIVAPMGMPKSDVHAEVERVLPDGTVKVNHAVAMKYAEQLKLYKAGVSSEAAGTPLRDLIGMTAAMAMNLKARGIHTVEMLAEVQDAAGQDIMGFWEFRDRARKHIELREKNAPMVKIEAIEAAHKKETDALRKQIDDLTKIVSKKKPVAEAA